MVIHPQKGERKNAKPQHDGHEPFPRDINWTALRLRRQAVSAPSNKKDCVEPKQAHKKEATGNESKKFMLRGLDIEKEDTGNAKKEEEKAERQ